MNQPFLHLFTHEPNDPVRRAIRLEELLPLAGTSSPVDGSRLVTFASEETDGRLPTLLATALQRHPSLAHVEIAPLPAMRYCGQGIGDLLVFMQPDPVRGELLFDAMHRRVPVLVPDTWHDIWVRDGITGFLYRAGDPDSLALSLLAFAALPATVLAEIVGRAHTHAIDLSPSRRIVPPEQPTGESS